MKYWSLDDFTRSSYASAHNINNSADRTIANHLEELCQVLLEPLTDAWKQKTGGSVSISSGYRSPYLNSAIGGAKNSAHMSGYAADIKNNGGGSMNDFSSFVNKWLHDTGVAFDQYIDEYSGSSHWVHLAVRNDGGEQRRMYLVYKNGKYTVLEDGADGTTSGGNYVYNGSVSSGDNNLSQQAQPNAARPIMASRGKNTVYKLASVINGKANGLQDDRKDRFSAMQEEFSNTAPELGRDILLTTEMYGSEILKGQKAKTYRDGGKSKKEK